MRTWEGHEWIMKKYQSRKIRPTEKHNKKTLKLTILSAVYLNWQEKKTPNLKITENIQIIEMKNTEKENKKEKEWGRGGEGGDRERKRECE